MCETLDLEDFALIQKGRSVPTIPHLNPSPYIPCIGNSCITWQVIVDVMRIMSCNRPGILNVSEKFMLGVIFAKC